MLIRIEMRDGIFSFYIRSDETAIRAIAIVENDTIRDLIAPTSIPSNAWSIPSTGCKRIVIPIGVLSQWNTLTLKASLCVTYQRDSKVKRGKSSFGSKEGLMQTSASGLKSKERGFKIFRGIARHTVRSEARLEAATSLIEKNTFCKCCKYHKGDTNLTNRRH